MGVRVDFSQVKDGGGNFGPIPFGKHPARLHIDAYQMDAQKNFMLDGDGQKVYFRSKKGDIQWKMRVELLDGPALGREMLDYLTFSEGGLKRIKVLAARIGLDITGPIDMEPEDLDGSYWIVDVDSHEVAQEASGQIKNSKYMFKRGDCDCACCKQWDGKAVNVNAKIAFAGFELMPAAIATQFASSAPALKPGEDMDAALGAADNGKPPF